MAWVDVDGRFWVNRWGSVRRRFLVGCLEGASLEGVFLVAGEGGVEVEGSNVGGGFVAESLNLSDVARGRLLRTTGGRVWYRLPDPSKRDTWSDR